MRRTICGLALIELGLGVGLALAQSAAPKPIRDDEFSLARSSVFEVVSPPAVEPNRSDPGERPLPLRAHAEMPPTVPHDIADFLPITRSDNACMDCHAIELKEPGEPTPIPPSHYVDFRDAPGRVGGQVAAERHVCVSCHVRQTGARPLVANGFAPLAETRAEEGPEPDPSE